MKIAIHHHSGRFSDKWIEYCKVNHIDYGLINCYDSDIIQQLTDYDALMWHWAHTDQNAVLFARQLTASLEMQGKKVFPNTKTCWHFDDKLAQKYLFEAIGAPLVPTYVFYEMDKALEWAEKTTYPKVFKLRAGAGSSNVRLVENKAKAAKLINQAFTDGFSPIPSISNDLKIKVKRIKSLSIIFKKILNMPKAIKRRNVLKKSFSTEQGYAYFQDFIPNNDHDIRVIVIGEKAFAIKRMVRENDFRASGSGVIKYHPMDIPLDCIKIAYELVDKLDTQTAAFDFVFNGQKTMLVEISYGFSSKGYLDCPGYWDKHLNWHEGKFTPEWFMIDDLIKSISSHQ